ncbi:MAG: T9SS type A sorting domain-containing protein [Ignavibacteriaceae bacterium]|nr:T9SS type A sorting domain-containing protein [Ignavibacteriaceae bacterium]
MIKTAGFLILIFTVAFPQNFKREISPFNISSPAGAYTNPFSGGVNNIEPHFVDIDGDNDFDLFFLDSDGSHGWFKNTGSVTNPVFEMQADTLPGIEFFGWFYFADIDADGDYDYFTSNSNNHIRLFKNTGSKFQPFFSVLTDTLLDIDGNIIFSESGSNPVYADVDGDGDADFISGNSIGTLNFYENTGSPQNFRLKFITSFWQEILIISGDNSSLHGASALEFGDLDSDGDPDLLWGDFFSQSIYYLQNNGTPSVPNIQLKYSVYPNNSDSLKTSGFNMPRLCDIDGDGDKDLFVSVLYDPTVGQTLMFFKNNGTASLPDFRLHNEDFLNTLDLGVNSYPTLADLDGDGDKDLIIGHGKGTTGRVSFFRSTGVSAFGPFILEDGTLSAVNSDLTAAPAFADIDGDADQDMFTGNFDGTISLYTNQGTAGNPLFNQAVTLSDSAGAVIDVGLYAAPFTYDIDADGDFDLVSGAFNGRIFLFRNAGNSSSYLFVRDDNYFAGIDAGDNSAPYFTDMNNDGKPELFIGSRNGRVYRYDNSGTVLQPQWVLNGTVIYDNRSGGNTVPLLVDADGDSDRDLILGCSKGGLLFFRNTETGTSIRGKERPLISGITVYPNPSRGSFVVRGNCGNGGIEGTLEVFTTAGEKISEEKINSDNSGEFVYICSGEGISRKIRTSGIYIISIRFPDFHQSVKLTLVK